MAAALLALGAAALVAVGFAGLANLVLVRRPASLAEWNESFLAGLGIATAVSVPLSLLSRPWLPIVILIGLLSVTALRRSDFAGGNARNPAKAQELPGSRSRWR